MAISRDPVLRLEESLLHGSNVIILGDLNCNLIGGDPNGNALSDFRSTFGLSQLVKTAIRVTEKIQVTYRGCFDNEREYHSCM